MNARVGHWLTVASLLMFPSLAIPAGAVTVPTDFPTIQAAVSAIRSGALPDGTVVDVLPGTYARFAIAGTGKSMTIRSTGGPSVTTINAGGAGTAIIAIGATGFIRIEGFTVTGGVGPPGNGGGFTFQDASPMLTNMTFQLNTAPSGGGGVLTRSNAVFANCVIQNNSATQFGGGLVITVGSRPTFTNCLIQNNVSGTASSIGSGGGAHINDASPTFISSSIVNNRAAFAGGGLLAIGVFGSAFGEATLTLEDCDVANNVAARVSAGDLPAEGGGVHIENNMVGLIRRSRIRNNTANTGGGMSGYRARYIIESSIIEGNQAPDPANVGGFGGGVESSSNNVVDFQRAASITITDTVVRNNGARIGGGIFLGGDQFCGGGACSDFGATKATLTITDSLVDGNVASVQAGGIFTTRTNVAVTNSLVSRNQANGGGSGFGGGFAIVSGTAATLSNTRIAGNSATAVGGGLYVDVNTTANISSSTIYANIAPAGGGGGIFVGSQGSSSGSVQNNLIVDNAGTAIVEQCPGASTRLSYASNQFGTSGTVYSGVCNPPGTRTASQMGNGNSSGLNLPNIQGRAFFQAIPSSTPSVLSWSVVRATGITINPGPFSSNLATGTVDVAVAANQTYTSTAATTHGGVGPLADTVLGPPVRFGGTGDIPVTRDYDGDGQSDLAVYRPATGEWFIFASRTGFETRVFGAAAVFGLGDTPVPADFDGDRKADLAIYRKATGEWLVFRSRDGFLGLVFGSAAALGLGDVPAPADFDGDGTADLAVYRSATGEWFVFGTRDGFMTLLFGAPAALGLGDTPVPADYDGDGKADLAVFRKATGEWFVFGTRDGFMTLLFGAPAALGLGDVPLPADYDGDRRADLAVRQSMNSTWFIFGSRAGLIQQAWGSPTDFPVPGDFDGNDSASIAVWRPGDGSWIIMP